MSPTPLSVLKADFFKSLAHPARIRVLEILSAGDASVAQLLPQVGLEPSHLSQQLAVLRRVGLVTSAREGSSVVYSLAVPQVAELLAVARSVLDSLLAENVELLTDLRREPEPTAVPPGVETES
ncbi:MAG: ArsR/SmtB family transcription factor [Actinomycetes bacterium]